MASRSSASTLVTNNNIIVILITNIFRWLRAAAHRPLHISYCHILVIGTLVIVLLSMASAWEQMSTFANHGACNGLALPWRTLPAGDPSQPSMLEQGFESSSTWRERQLRPSVSTPYHINTITNVMITDML